MFEKNVSNGADFVWLHVDEFIMWASSQKKVKFLGFIRGKKSIYLFKTFLYSRQEQKKPFSRQYGALLIA